MLLSRLDSGLVSLRPARYRLIGPFSIPAASPRNRRGNPCSRIRALGIEIRADNGGFSEPDSSLNHSCVARCAVQYPPVEYCCLVVIMGETGDSGYSLGLDARAKKDGQSSAIPERFVGENLKASQIAEQGSF